MVALLYVTSSARPAECRERLELEQNYRDATATLDAAMQERRERIAVCTREEFLRLRQKLEAAGQALWQIQQDLDRHIKEHCCLANGSKMPGCS